MKKLRLKVPPDGTHLTGDATKRNLGRATSSAPISGDQRFYDEHLTTATQPLRVLCDYSAEFGVMAFVILVSFLLRCPSQDC
jgi:hypothetical protein